QKLAIEVPPSGQPVRIRAGIAEAEAKISETSLIIGLAEERERQEKSLRLSLENTGTSFAGEERALQETRHQLATAISDCERLTKECATLAEELEKIKTSLLADVEPFGILRITPGNPSAILAELTRRRDDWQIKERDLTGQEKKVETLKAVIEKNEALHENLKQALEVKRRDCDRLRDEHDSLQTSRRELFGDKSADE
ncbi:MAG: hypothetical protein ACYC6Q_12745, partial [Syntrophales bacterium]